MNKRWDRLQEPTLKTRFGHFYAGLKIDENDSCAPLFKPFVFLAKRLLIIQVTLFASDEAYIQVMVYIALQLFSCIYVIEVLPM